MKNLQFISELTSDKTDWGFKHLGQLRGSLCVDIVKDPDFDRNDPLYGLVFRSKDGILRTAWIFCDPEGNGAGHLDIIKAKITHVKA